jgi:hypothetical protein
MEKQPLVVLLGESLLMDGLAVSLAGRQTLGMLRIDTNVVENKGCLESLKPDLVLFELDHPWAPDILSLLSEQPGIWLIGLHLSSNRVIVLNSQQYVTPTMNELCQVVQAEAREKARLSSGGEFTGRNGTWR